MSTFKVNPIWVNLGAHAPKKAYKSSDKKRERTRICMARLYAERTGKPTDKFPPRVKRRDLKLEESLAGVESYSARNALWNKLSDLGAVVVETELDEIVELSAEYIKRQKIFRRIQKLRNRHAKTTVQKVEGLHLEPQNPSPWRIQEVGTSQPGRAEAR